MKDLKYLVLMMLPLLFSSVSEAQPAESQRLNGVYEELTDERQIIAYDHIREADVFWRKRIWRVIDAREKMNKTFVYPKRPLIDILLESVMSERVTVFEDEDYTIVKTAKDVSTIGAGTDTIAEYDEFGNYVGEKVVQNEFDPTTVMRFRIKEDWFFDEETSTMQVRIIGIAPLFFDEEIGMDIPMFWAYYPDLRSIMVNEEVFNPLNDAIFFTWEDLFEMRLFSSYIMKVSNVYDRRIVDYATGVDALLESDRVEDMLFKTEHDLWSY